MRHSNAVLACALTVGLQAAAYAAESVWEENQKTGTGDWILTT